MRARGFSLIELLIATAITVGVGAIIFQLFHQNERVFRDQALVTEMQQAARAVTSQIADDIRIAGAGVPVYAKTYDSELREATTVILPGSDSERLHLRAGISNTESNVATPTPFDLEVGNGAALKVGSATVFTSQIGTSPSGRYIYLWGPTEQGWGWARAAVNSIASASRTIRITTVESDSSPIRFIAPPTMSLEEAIAIYRDGATNTLRRTTAVRMTDPAKPDWAPANELAANVTSLTFTYYDAADRQIVPDTLASRSEVTRIDVRVVVQTAGQLAGGSRASYALSTRSVPRNLRIR